jgi:formamidopyrimidine-DNA glycosylase
MPELAEVEFYRKQWDVGLRRSIQRVHLHAGKRVTRGVDALAVVNALTGAKLLGSEAHAKQMLFRFSDGAWLGIHLGMTGKLSVADAGFVPDRHDHLVLFQKDHALVFRDPRMFGRVRFHQGAKPEWWTDLPPAIGSPQFTADVVKTFLKRRARTAIKAVLLMQERFPGVGNWMADEILWQAKIAPTRLCGRLKPVEIQAVFHFTKVICAGAMETVGVDFSDPPKGWLFHERWTGRGKCPTCGKTLKTAQVGGRTTRWCVKCQR